MKFTGFVRAVLLLIFCVTNRAAVAQTEWSVDRVDLNTVVVRGPTPTLEEIKTEDQSGVFLFPGDEAIVLRGSPAMTENRRKVLENEDSDQLIVGDGFKAQLGQFSWQVALVDPIFSDPYFGQFCAGAILDESWVLTAAHCVYQAYAGDSVVPTATVQVVAGRVSLTKDVPRISVKRIIIHESWTKGDRSIPFDNDLALIELAESLVWSDFIRPAVLSTQAADDLLEEGRILRVTGWGRTEPRVPGSRSRDLLWMDVNVIENATCSEFPTYQERLTGNMFCAAHAGGACKGDSGGGVISREVASMPLVGIVSWAEGGCTTASSPGVFVRVSEYLNWINDHMH